MFGPSRRLQNLTILALLLCARFGLYQAIIDSDDDFFDEFTELPEHEKAPFRNPKSETIGCVLLFTLVALSNAGGLSGAGSIIPIMLIFFDLHMFEAVPVSAFVAVCATCFRFLLNFNQMHPNCPERVAINYEVVEITMPFVFLGSFYGVQLGHIVGEIVQVVVFGVSVAWSIKTTLKKACELIAKENCVASDDDHMAMAEEEMMEVPMMEDEMMMMEEAPDSFASGYDLDMIKYQESHHFTSNRMLFMLANFIVLFINNMVFKTEGYSITQK